MIQIDTASAGLNINGSFLFQVSSTLKSSTQVKYLQGKRIARETLSSNHLPLLMSSSRTPRRLETAVCASIVM